MALWLLPGEVGLESVVACYGGVHLGTFILCNLGWVMGSLGNTASSGICENLNGTPVPSSLCVFPVSNEPSPPLSLHIDEGF